MSACTFFGHRDCPASIRPVLFLKVIGLIENHSVDLFYIGCQGAFDVLARSCVEEAAKIHPHIRYYIILEKMPSKPNQTIDYAHTLLPDGIERVHPRFAISFRNKWMLLNADYVISYVIRSFSGAVHFTEMAKKQGKTVISIIEKPHAPE